MILLVVDIQNDYFSKEVAYKYFNEFMWPKRYAEVITVEQAIQRLRI